MTAFLARPSEEYKESFIEAVREFHTEGKYYAHLDVAQLEQDFGSFVYDLLRREKRETQDLELVPDTFFWLIDGDEYIGRVSIRHELIGSGHIGYDIRPSKRQMGYGTLILRLALEEAKKIGLPKVLIVCNTDNIGSQKIIEANGGVLESEVVTEHNGQESRHLRYWIALV